MPYLIVHDKPLLYRVPYLGPISENVLKIDCRPVGLTYAASPRAADGPRAPDPIAKIEKNPRDRNQFPLHLSRLPRPNCGTKDRHLIPNYEEKGYDFSSHTYRKGFSRDKSDIR